MPISEKLLHSIVEQTDEDGLMRLVPMEKSLISFEYTVKEFRSALDGILASDEDLSNLYLSFKEQYHKPRPIQDHTEGEFLLENYAKKGTNGDIDVDDDQPRNWEMKLNKCNKT